MNLRVGSFASSAPGQPSGGEHQDIISYRILTGGRNLRVDNRIEGPENPVNGFIAEYGGSQFPRSYEAFSSLNNINCSNFHEGEYYRHMRFINLVTGIPINQIAQNPRQAYDTTINRLRDLYLVQISGD